ncbi:MAG: hypothetical protein AAFY59_08255 [Pseudomonadota bacterium]
MPKGDHPLDPRGLIMEAYRIEGITAPDCRTIFFDWALGLDAELEPGTAVAALLAHYGGANPDHPMTAVLREGLAPSDRQRRRRGRQR